jgi:hypothetical protein
VHRCLLHALHQYMTLTLCSELSSVLHYTNKSMPVSPVALSQYVPKGKVVKPQIRHHQQCKSNISFTTVFDRTKGCRQSTGQETSHPGGLAKMGCANNGPAQADTWCIIIHNSRPKHHTPGSTPNIKGSCACVTCIWTTHIQHAVLTA